LWREGNRRELGRQGRKRQVSGLGKIYLWPKKKWTNATLADWHRGIGARRLVRHREKSTGFALRPEKANFSWERAAKKIYYTEKLPSPIDEGRHYGDAQTS